MLLSVTTASQSLVVAGFDIQVLLLYFLKLLLLLLPTSDSDE
jgi:hypothetical protein